MLTAYPVLSQPANSILQVARGYLMAAILCGLTSAIANTASASEILAPVEHYQLDIKRTQLTEALRKLGEQIHLQIARFADVEPANPIVGPLSGNYTRAEALTSLLHGTGLTYVFVNDRT